MSALITLVIVVMWAAVLVPMWMHRHERGSELTSVDRFAGAMRVLSRREPGPGRAGPVGRRYVVMPSRPASSRQPTLSGARVPPSGSRRPGAPGPGSAAVRRRRRTLAVLVVLVLLTAVAAASAGGAFVGLQLLCDLLLAAGLVRTRQLVLLERRRAVARARRSRALRADLAGAQPRAGEDRRAAAGSTAVAGRPVPPTTRRGSHPGTAPTAAPAEWAGEGEPRTAAAGHGSVGTAAAGTRAGYREAAGSAVAPPDDALPQVPGAAGQVAGGAGQVAGRAVPRAPQPMVLDLTRPGSWVPDSGAMPGAGAVVPPAAGTGAGEDDLDELDVILTRRRAVNE